MVKGIGLQKKGVNSLQKGGSLIGSRHRLWFNCFAPLNLVDTSQEATELNHLVRQSHTEATDKLYYPSLE
eukprot:11246517-Prorocentrum_lima.AAC.1